jgi:hypothetical protein
MRILLCIVFFLALTGIAFGNVIVDNGDSGTTFTGSWGVSGAQCSYGDTSLYSRHTGDIYTYSANETGVVEVSLWWTEWSSRSASVPVEIYDGDTLLDTVLVNQTAQGGQWNVVGQYEIANNIRATIKSMGDNKSTCADAVKFVQVVETVDVAVTVTWNRPEGAEEWAGLVLRVNNDTMINISDPLPTVWEGILTLRMNRNVFDMQSVDAGGQHSLWSEPAYYTYVWTLVPPLNISATVTE